ncbi:polyamine deacetylase HDAC10 isoform X1 [Cyrtonyx montezumae]|uniref:polyamine deacetylase HDAC10 isoform X1 n=1 Tax=Cyrtonyx montezumae TaxID=9017 RepID=UPI0032DB2872
MASGTALVYHEAMTRHKLLWNDPLCDIEVPERLSASYEQLQCYHLVERCVPVPAREGSEEEILLVHSSEHLEVAKSTQTMNEEELKRISGNYDSFFFHPNTYHCARLAVGATLQLVDSVMSGKVCNGMALVRPPGHHSQRNAANGFCLFNNVAIAAEYAKLKYSLQRILIVDWDVHHGQGTQYIFEEDPSVLYFSWHRYEHQEFWPSLKESDYDAVGLGKGKGFNINLPWNKVGMGNSDYLAAFFHVLLPVAFEFDPELVLVSSGYDSGIGDPEGQMNATPEVFAHLTHFLMQLAHGKLCVILEGGYHLKSLSESVCMTVRALLRDPLPQVTGEMAPCLSAIESIQNVRAAHKPYWKWLMYEDASFLHNLSTKSDLVKTADINPSTEHEVKITDSSETDKIGRFLELHMKKIIFPVPPIKTATTAELKASADPDTFPVHLHVVKEMDKNEIKALVSDVHTDLVKSNKTLLSLGSTLAILDKILKKEVCSGIAESPAASASLAVALRHSLHFGFQRVLCIFVGDMQVMPNTEDGRVLVIHVCKKEQTGKSSSKHYIVLNWKEDADGNDFFSAVLGLILPVAYSYQPNLIVIAVGPNRSLGISGISLLLCLLQGLAESRILAVMEDSDINLRQSVASALAGASMPHFGVHVPPTQEKVNQLKILRNQLQQDWKMLQCSVNDGI